MQGLGRLRVTPAPHALVEGMPGAAHREAAELEVWRQAFGSRLLLLFLSVLEFPWAAPEGNHTKQINTAKLQSEGDLLVGVTPWWWCDDESRNKKKTPRDHPFPKKEPVALPKIQKSGQH